jgi:predicted Zn-dependent protease
MKNFQPIVCAGILVVAMSAPAFAKTGIISTTKTGIISTTRTGIISTTRAGTSSTDRAGIISTTRTGLTSTNRIDSMPNSDRFSLVELLLTVFGPW